MAVGAVARLDHDRLRAGAGVDDIRPMGPVVGHDRRPEDAGLGRGWCSGRAVEPDFPEKRIRAPRTDVHEDPGGFDPVPVQRRALTNDRRGGAGVGRCDAHREPDRFGRQERHLPAVGRPVEIERRVIGAPIEGERRGHGRRVGIALAAGLEDVDPAVARGPADRGDPRAVRRPGREHELDAVDGVGDEAAAAVVHRREGPGRVDDGDPRRSWGAGSVAEKVGNAARLQGREERHGGEQRQGDCDPKATP